MKKWMQRWIPLALMLCVFSSSALAQNRVATVDLRKVFDGYWKRKQAEAALKERETELKKELDGLRESLKKLTEDYQKSLAEVNDQAVSAEERDRRKQSAQLKLKEIKESEDTIKQFVTQADASLLEQKRRMRDGLLESIRATVSAKAKSSGYGLVVDTAAETPNGTPVVVYSSGENDITEEVLKQLNAGAPAETGK